ncbi:hypothetical protein ABNF97_12610 [Plantactinospora sp. B6F1]|uniref:hypothetical protein n=1 Tax=Plantactinospora sp. B6F1 TaxID=3158971 RepID=UPI0032D92FB6
MQLIADRGCGHAPLLRVDATRDTATTTVLLTFAQLARVLGEVIHLPHPVGAWQLQQDPLPRNDGGNRPAG